MCGLAGFNGASAPNINKLQILGMLNVQRGKHSCGISLNNKIGYGINQQSEFQNLIEKYQLPELFDKTNNVIIHTRHATMGAHSIDNAHPFGFAENPLSTEYSFIGAHNGKLTNHVELLNKYHIDPKSFTVDSEALLFILFIEKNFKVLSEYKGDAALIFTYVDEPNTLYAFKGAAGGELERPLYYSRHNEGVYFSSLLSSLNIIGNHKYNVFEVPDNTVLKFVNGDLKERFSIARKKEIKPTTVALQTTPNQTLFDNRSTNSFNPEVSKQIFFKKMFDKQSISPFQSINKEFTWKWFRYFRNGHLANGCFVKNKINSPGFPDQFIWIGDGVILKDKKAWEEFEQMKKNTPHSRPISLSQFWKYPTPDVEFKTNSSVESEGKCFYENRWNFSNINEEEIKIWGTDLSYIVKGGYAISISKSTQSVITEEEEDVPFELLHIEASLDELIMKINKTITEIPANAMIGDHRKTISQFSDELTLLTEHIEEIREQLLEEYLTE